MSRGRSGQWLRSCADNEALPYSLVAVLLRQLLADELVAPLVRLVARVTHEARNNERHYGGGLRVVW